MINHIRKTIVNFWANFEVVGKYLNKFLETANIVNFMVN